MTNRAIFYTLPAEDIEVGMSTDDGQDFLKVGQADEDGWIWTHVYTPADSPDEDYENRCAPDGRGYQVGTRVDMADFTNTPNPGHQHPHAICVEEDSDEPDVNYITER